MDIIAKCAFGLKIDNLEDKQNIFMEKAQQTFTSETNTSPLMLLFCKNMHYMFFIWS